MENNILSCIGNTPLVQLKSVVGDNCAQVFVKCEFMNPTGSIKDRMALHIIEAAEKKGLLKPGGTIVENTSGNTGLSLAMVAAVKGYKAIFTLPDKMSQEKINMIKSFGAEVVVTPTDVPGDSPDHYVNKAKKIAQNTPNSFYVDQYHNQDNIEAHYQSTGPEIWDQTNGEFDYFVAGTGTGGTVSGVGKFLNEKNENIKVIGVDPYGSVHYHYFYTQKLVQPHVYKVEGIGEDILCKAMDFSVVNEMVQTNDQQAFSMARRLVREEGLFCGGSSGAIVHAAVELAKTLPRDKKIITLLTDSGSRYISKFLSDQWMNDHGFLNMENSLGTVNDILVNKDYVPVISINDQSSIKEAIELMKESDVSQLPLVNTKNKILGIIHHDDIFDALRSQKIQEHHPVDSIMQEALGLASLDTTIEDLYKIFYKGRVAIVLENSKPKAIITKFDMIEYLMTKEGKET
ncbi:MAG: pyridoxal-phosphate dependent enzyme [Francisellaceae bacterium]|jgi:cystathionine beta-synthase|nr:pyridoxal-phosphate dependent enzyme [Francisellaceae bacterium]